MGPGQTKYWLGHLNALRENITQKWTNSLIVEDDANWDIAIKYQLSLLVPMIREVT